MIKSIKYPHFLLILIKIKLPRKVSELLFLLPLVVVVVVVVVGVVVIVVVVIVVVIVVVHHPTEANKMKEKEK